MSHPFDLCRLRNCSHAWFVILLVSLLASLNVPLQAQSHQPARAGKRPTRRPAFRPTTPQQRQLIRHNEAGALVTLRTLSSAEATYQATTGQGNYGTIEQLGKEGLIDSVLAEGHRFGYLFRVKREMVSSESQASIEIFAVPRSYGRTGRRSFYVDDPWGNGLCFVDENTLFTGR